jgi:hypothetical protein
LLLRFLDKELAEAPEAVSAGGTAAAFISAALEPAPSPFLFPVPCSLFSVSTTAEIGFEVGLVVASTLPGNWLRSATSLAAFALFVATLFGTGRATVGFTVTAARGAGASPAASTIVSSLFPIAWSLFPGPCSLFPASLPP